MRKRNQNHQVRFKNDFWQQVLGKIPQLTDMVRKKRGSGVPSTSVSSQQLWLPIESAIDSFYRHSEMKKM